jgi:hypothetical protein
MLDVACNHVRNMLATRSQHVLFECCKHHSSQHGKSSSQHRKSCLQHHYASQRDQRLIRSLIWIVRSRIRLMLAPGSDVRALAVPFKKLWIVFILLNISFFFAIFQIFVFRNWYTYNIVIWESGDTHPSQAMMSLAFCTTMNMSHIYS